MLKKIEESLCILSEQLEILWRDYLTAKPEKWLWELGHSATELAEARKLRDEIGGLQAHLGCIRHTLKHSHSFDPIRKEN